MSTSTAPGASQAVTGGDRDGDGDGSGDRDALAWGRLLRLSRVTLHFNGSAGPAQRPRNRELTVSQKGVYEQ